MRKDFLIVTHDLHKGCTALMADAIAVGHSETVRRKVKVEIQCHHARDIVRVDDHEVHTTGVIGILFLWGQTFTSSPAGFPD